MKHAGLATLLLLSLTSCSTSPSDVGAGRSAKASGAEQVAQRSGRRAASLGNSTLRSTARSVFGTGPFGRFATGVLGDTANVLTREIAR